MDKSQTMTAIAALNERIAYLLSPDRKSGPARGEVEDEAKELQIKLDSLNDDLFYFIANERFSLTKAVKNETIALAN